MVLARTLTLDQAYQAIDWNTIIFLLGIMILVAHFLARTRSRLLALSLEDLLNVADQPNIPGTVDEHPNWRQRLPVAIDRIADAIDVAALKRATGERSEKGAA